MARHDPVRAVRAGDALRRRGRPAAAALALAVAAGAGGCDAQAHRDYPGEPLLTLRGQVQGTPPLPPLEAAMLWQLGAPPSTGIQELAVRAPIESGFPAGFTIRLYQPPPSAARRVLAPGEVSFARGNVAAVPYGIATTAVPWLPAPQGSPLAGSSALDADHWVVHLAADVPASTLTAWWLGAALPAGYHLLRVTAFDPACAPAEVEKCVDDLVALGVPRGEPDDGTQEGTARWFCLARYRLAPAPEGDLVILPLGTYVSLPLPTTSCTP